MVDGTQVSLWLRHTAGIVVVDATGTLREPVRVEGDPVNVFSVELMTLSVGQPTAVIVSTSGLVTVIVLVGLRTMDHDVDTETVNELRVGGSRLVRVAVNRCDTDAPVNVPDTLFVGGNRLVLVDVIDSIEFVSVFVGSNRRLNVMDSVRVCSSVGFDLVPVFPEIEPLGVIMWVRDAPLHVPDAVGLIVRVGRSALDRVMDSLLVSSLEGENVIVRVTGGSRVHVVVIDVAVIVFVGRRRFVLVQVSVSVATFDRVHVGVAVNGGSCVLVTVLEAVGSLDPVDVMVLVGAANRVLVAVVVGEGVERSVAESVPVGGGTTVSDVVLVLDDRVFV